MVADKIVKALHGRAPQTLGTNGHKPAAVLVPIQERQGGDYLVLTKRADHLRTHKGQIAFPGGRVDAVDAMSSKRRSAKAGKRSASIPAGCGFSAAWMNSPPATAWW